MPQTRTDGDYGRKGGREERREEGREEGREKKIQDESRDIKLQFEETKFIGQQLGKRVED